MAAYFHDENLFRHGNIGSGGIHRIRGELPPAEAVRKATADLITAAGVKAGGMPVFDVVLLGMGEDGHVASLFPGDAVTSQDRSSIFIAVGNSPKPPPNRVTLGHAPVSAAREVWVLATGQGKEAALRESISTSGHTPLAQVIRSRAVTKIFTDIACERTPKISAAGL